MRLTTEFQKRKQGKRRYRVIAKVSADHFVKYRTNNIEKFLIFLQQKFPGVMYANFFYGKGPQVGKQFASWGKRKGLHNL